MAKNTGITSPHPSPVKGCCVSPGGAAASISQSLLCIAEAKCQASAAKKPGPLFFPPPSPTARALPRVISHRHWSLGLCLSVVPGWRFQGGRGELKGLRLLPLSTRLQKQKCPGRGSSISPPHLQGRRRYLPQEERQIPRRLQTQSSLGKRPCLEQSGDVFS